MKQHWLTDTAKISTLLLVSGLLIGHGTRQSHPQKIAWSEKSIATLEFDLSQQTPVRRFHVEVNTSNYLPLHDNLPLWSESFTVQGTKGTVDPALSFALTDTGGHERFRIHASYVNHKSRPSLTLVRASTPRPPPKSKYLPIVASCKNKNCTASSILVISRDPKAAAAVQHISLEYSAELLGPPYCTDCPLERRPRKPGGVKINLQLTELK